VALLSLANIIHDHVSDFLHAVLFLRKVHDGTWNARHVISHTTWRLARWERQCRARRARVKGTARRRLAMSRRARSGSRADPIRTRQASRGASRCEASCVSIRDQTAVPQQRALLQRGCASAPDHPVTKPCDLQSQHRQRLGRLCRRQRNFERCRGLSEARARGQPNLREVSVD
jgi:hypothetical protein